MEDKHEKFWKQGDFGYVKDVTDTLMTLCLPEEKVMLPYVLNIPYTLY